MIYSKEKLDKLQHRWTTPQGKKFLEKLKESRGYLSPVIFRDTLKKMNIRSLPFINDEEVIEKVDLRGANFSGFDFRVPIQEEDEGFSEDIVVLTNIAFEGANLKHCIFEDGKLHNCSFDHSDLGHAQLSNADILNCSFQQATCDGINLRGSKLVDCNFNEASIRDIILDTTIVDQKTNFGKGLRSEKEGNYHFASIEYKQIKEMYKNSSLHEFADHFHYLEMVAKRKIPGKGKLSQFFNYIFGDLLCKYGTSFIRVLIWGFVIIVICALIIMGSGTISYNSSAIKPNFIDSFYFSIVTFTTLGYGDFHPVGFARFVAGIEALVGASLIALFTVIVARKIIRD